MGSHLQQGVCAGGVRGKIRQLLEVPRGREAHRIRQVRLHPGLLRHLRIRFVAVLFVLSIFFLIRAPQTTIAHVDTVSFLYLLFLFILSLLFILFPQVYYDTCGVVGFIIF